MNEADLMLQGPGAPNVLMKCGCRAQAVNRDGDPVCVVHAGLTPDAYIPMKEVNLEGRKARCSGYGKRHDRHYKDCIFDECQKHEDHICRCERPSSLDLPFFVYTGEGSPTAENFCKNCGLHRNYHNQEKKMLYKACDNFEPQGPQEYDIFYCGCSVGWD